VIWTQWRRLRQPEVTEVVERPFEDLLEEAPVPALLLDRDQLVVAANQLARAFFGIAPERLPMGLVEATREANLAAAVTAGRPENDLRLSHRRRLVRTKVVPGPQTGSSLLFITDVTELRRLESVRQEFVANLAHELKTPITSLRLAVESLQGGELRAEARRRLLGRAVREVDYLSLVIANLRQLAELDTGSDTSHKEQFEVAALVADVVDRLRLTQPVEVQVPAGLWVTADQSKLAQALTNLLDNAAKFSPPASPVEVVAALEGSELVLRVRDHGPGISPEHWERVFERFYKVDQSHTRVGSGSGLGLSLVRHLALSMDGRVWTEAASGGGQVFGVAIPISEGHNLALSAQ
jgi:signal transduction histidine kinase